MLFRSSRVKEGQIISYVGNTGDAAGGPCHLHFEYHKGTGVFTPFPFLEQATITQLDPANPLSANTATAAAAKAGRRML